MRLSTIYFVRHAQSDNPEFLVKSRLPGFVLTQLGKQQAALTAAYLKLFPVSVIFSGPMVRSQQTAEIIHNALKCQAVRIDSRLNEWDMTPWTGKPFLTRKTEDRTLWESYQETPDIVPFTEKLSQVAVRMQEFVASALKKFAGEQLVAVSHSDTIKAARLSLENKPLRAIHTIPCRLGSITALHFDGNRLASVAYHHPAAKLDALVNFE